MAAVAKESVLNRLPIIVILGATGTGKSKLALEVAKKFNGEVISADAMQVYRGLDVITNKVGAEEKSQVPHHMMDYLSPCRPTTVTDFRDRALTIVDDLLARHRLPVVAGGTNYYVESLLWKVLIANTEDGEGGAPTFSKRARYHSDLEGLGKLRYLVSQEALRRDTARDVVEALGAEDKEQLHRVLKAVDPVRADELHPNNVRKVIRSLQVFSSTGRRHSDLIREQREAGGNAKGGPLRYPHCAVLWITCDQTVLDGRLDVRVDDMIKQGLIEEMQEFHEQYNRQRLKDDNGEAKQLAYTIGIFQSIGFKEFHDYLMLDQEQRTSKEGQKLFDKGLELMKLATRQYAKRQVKWVRRRFLARGKDEVPPVYALNGTSVSEWDHEVRDKAFSVVQAMLKGQPSPIPAEDPQTPSTVVHKIEKCETCDRLFASDVQMKAHLKSQKHRRKLEHSKRQNLTYNKNPVLIKD